MGVVYLNTQIRQTTQLIGKNVGKYVSATKIHQNANVINIRTEYQTVEMSQRRVKVKRLADIQ